MKNDSFNEILSDNPIAQLDTGNLLLLVFFAIGASWLLAWILKKQYNARYLIRSYLFYGLIHCFIGFIIMDTATILVLGSYLLGGVFTLFCSNHYFYE